MDSGIQIEFWHWWSLGGVLLIVEMVTGSTFALWIALSAGIVGLLLVFFPDLPLVWQGLNVGVISVASILLWMRYERTRSSGSDQPLLNRRGHQLVGRSFVLEEPIVNGFGKIRVDDSIWKVSGPDLPIGSRVKVSDIQGTVLAVVAE